MSPVLLIWQLAKLEPESSCIQNVPDTLWRGRIRN